MITNGIGILMMIVSFLLGGAISAAIKGEKGMFLIIGGVLVVICDLLYRLIHRDGHLFYPSGGGHFWFAPLWGWGIVWAVMGALGSV